MKIAIIGAGQMARIIALKAHEMNIIVHCFAWEDGAIAKEYVDYFHAISIFEKDKIFDICKQNGIDGVIPTTELTISIASYIANKMNLNTNPMEISENITNKGWVRRKATDLNLINQPEFNFVSSVDDVEKIEIKSYPVIVKPVSEGGKRGITVVSDKTELKDALEFAFAEQRGNKGVLIEEYLLGKHEYSVESISYHGNHQIIQVTEKISSGPPHCVELGHSQPANVTDEMRNRVISAIKELLTNVGLVNGPAHTEIKIINNRIYLIELNARPGGDHIASPLTKLSTGYDYIQEIINVAMNKEPAIRDEEPCIKYAGVRFITKQTDYLNELFLNCDDEKWLFEKHVETSELKEINHNDCYHVNYFIYCDNNKPELLDKKGDTL